MAKNGSRGRLARDSDRAAPRRRRGVSPIIAMILLVASTVVLAAILYVLISGLSHGPAGAPIDTAFALGAPTAGTCWAAGVTNHVCGTSGDRLWNLSIEQSSVTLADLLLEVRTSTGSVLQNTLAAGFAVMPLTGAIPIAYYSLGAGAGLAMKGTFTVNAGYSTSTHLTSAMFIVIGTGIPASSWLSGQGNYVSIVGTGHFSGVEIGPTLP